MYDLTRGFCVFFFFFSSRRRHTRLQGDWSSDVCSSDLSSFINPAMTRVVPSLTITLVSALEVSMMGILLPAAVMRKRLTELTSGLIFMLTKPSSLMVGLTLSWRPKIGRAHV